jgi:hypothetical protein
MIREAGQPVQKTIVSMLRMDLHNEAFEPKTTTTDHEGKYRVSNISPGLYTFRVIKTEDIVIGGASREIVFKTEIPDCTHFGYNMSLPLGMVSGIVRDKESLAPLESVRVILRRSSNQESEDPLSAAMDNRVAEVYTDPTGHFKIANLRDGDYTIRAGGSNLLGINRGGYAVSLIQNIRVVNEGHHDGINIGLSRGGNLEGRVVDRRGLPVAGASIYIHRSELKEFETYSECITDGAGYFKYLGASPGQCAVIAKHPDFALTIEYKVQIDQEDTTTVDISMDEGTAVYLRLLGDDPHGLMMNSTIEFRDPSGRNLAGLSSIQDVMDRFFKSKWEEAKGILLGRFSPGKYLLKITHPKLGSKTNTVQITPNEKERTLKIDL